MLFRARNNPNGGHRVTYAGLAVLSALFLAVVVGIILMLQDAQQKAELGIREDALWATYQLDRETAKLLLELDRVVAAGEPLTPEVRDAIATRFDILFSRVRYIKSGMFESGTTDAAWFREGFDGVRHRIMDMAPAFDRLAGAEPMDVQDLSKPLAELEALRGATEELVIFTNQRVSTLKAEQRNGQVALFKSLTIAVALLVLTMGGTGVMLVRQIRAEAVARRKVEALAHELTDSAAAAEAGNTAKSAFLATIGHEIRTPLNGFLGMAEILRDTPLETNQVACLDAMQDCGAALLDLINDVLDYTKSEAGEFPVDPVPFGFVALVRSVFAMVEARALARGNRLVLDLPEGLPDTYLADPSRIRQVLVNLVGNAVKFTEGGTITVTARAEQGELRVEVTDTGIGIAPEVGDRIFDAFSQGDESISRRFGGTGLGLSICRSIVERLGGRIGYESRPGAGTRFSFAVPAPVVADDRVRPDAIAAPRLAPPVSGRVLVVEDNTVNREVARRLLERLGQTVELAASGEDGVRRAAEGGFDCIFMDMHMPGLDGVAAARAIRALPGPAAGVRIVALTANASEDHRRACSTAGMDGFLAKPITRQALAEALGVARGAGEAEASRPAARTGLDLQRRDELVAEIGADAFDELMASFVDDAEALLAALEAPSLAPQDVRGLLHTLRGAALNCGLVAVAELSSGTAVRPRDLAALHDAIAAIRPGTSSLAA